MHRFKPFVLASLAVAMLVGSVAPAAAAGPDQRSGQQNGQNNGRNRGPAEAWFFGTATSGVGSPMPVNINPADVRVRTDGSVGIGYTYLASGEAHGDGAGRFTYEEHGYLYFRNPADPTTYMGSTFMSAVFRLTPRKGGAPILIVDTNPAAYTSGIQTMPMYDLPKGAMKAMKEVFDMNRGQLRKGGSLTYGYFTFTNNYGTFTGYATPDFRQFAIAIKFDCPGCK